MRFVLAAAFLGLTLMPAAALEADETVPSRCIAIADALPFATYASFATPTQSFVDGPVTITYAGHSTYVIETPGGVRIATDFSGHYGTEPLPRVVTMNKAHRTHYTDAPDPRIEYVLRGWSPEGGPARHAVVIDDVYIRNVPTDIRSWGWGDAGGGPGGGMEPDGNSIFIFEVAGLCIGHLGHLHHQLEDAHYGAIGRLDIVMVPVDGGMTMSVEAMSEIATRLFSSIILPMHRHATPIAAFTGRMGETFDVRFSDARSFSVSLRDLPRRPTILILRGV